jgi:hypothetical protein
MKKLIVLMLALAPVIGFSQGRTDSTRETQSRDAAAQEAAKRESMDRGAQAAVNKFSDLFIEFVVSDQGGRQSIRMIKDSDMLSRVSDPTFQRDIETTSQQSFSTVADLMTMMSAKGWSFVSQYEIALRGQSSTRFVFKKQIAMPPYMITGEKPDSKDAPPVNAGMQGRTPGKK